MFKSRAFLNFARRNQEFHCSAEKSEESPEGTDIDMDAISDKQISDITKSKNMSM